MISLRGWRFLNTRGFSVVELLVVMAVITVLVAVLLPVAIQSRNVARSGVCISNLKQLSGAVALYAQDWSDRLPYLEGSAFKGSRPTDELPSGTSAVYLKNILASRIRSEKLFKCPNDIGSPAYGFSEEDGSIYSSIGTSYMPWSTTRAGLYGLRINGGILSELPRTSGICLLRDYGADWHGVRVREGLKAVALNRANAAFADGRVSGMEVCSVRTSSGEYVSVMGGSGTSSGRLEIAGKTGSGTIDLHGTCQLHQTPHEMKVAVSGKVTNADAAYDIDKIYTFSADAGQASMVRQIVSSLEDMVSE